MRVAAVSISQLLAQRHAIHSRKTGNDAWASVQCFCVLNLQILDAAQRGDPRILIV